MRLRTGPGVVFLVEGHKCTFRNEKSNPYISASWMHDALQICQLQKGGRRWVTSASKDVADLGKFVSKEGKIRRFQPRSRSESVFVTFVWDGYDIHQARLRIEFP